LSPIAFHTLSKLSGEREAKETYTYDDLAKQGSEQAVRLLGKMRQEGKEYEVKDGDVLYFKFNI